jgi:hypothetical protein
MKINVTELFFLKRKFNILRVIYGNITSDIRESYLRIGKTAGRKNRHSHMSNYYLTLNKNLPDVVKSVSRYI